MFAYVIKGFLLGGAAAAQPGPFQAYLMGLSLRNGWRRSLPAAFAPLLSDGPIIILMVFLLTKTPMILLHSLNILGGLFLMYLAYGAYKEARTEVILDYSSRKYQDERLYRSLGKATVMNFLNPHPYIFWATIAGPIFLESWREASRMGIAFMLSFYGSLIGGFILFLGIISAVGRLGTRAHFLLGIVSAAALFGFGIYMLLDGIMDFLIGVF
ncbi:MAG: LysE family transporter [Spirochaetia bacterium]|nr:LysE family transporter [Spirochaetia bacterium]MCF7953109.1 LysE family transporter [Spirochaetales bacterium]